MAIDGADAVNGSFEALGALLILLNVRRLRLDRRVAGVSFAPTAYFTIWGLWNLYYYPALDQWLSFAGGCAITMANAAWLVLAWRQGALRPPFGVRSAEALPPR